MVAKNKYWDGSTWQEVGVSASKATLIDNGNLINATNVEDALQEIVTKSNLLQAENANYLATKAEQSALEIEKARITNLATLAVGSTTGDAELIDGRTDRQGNIWPNIGESARNVMWKEVLYREGSTTSQYDISIKSGTPLTVTLSNTSAYDAYFKIELMKSSDAIISTPFDSLISASSSQVITVTSPYFDVYYVNIVDTNTRTFTVKVSAENISDMVKTNETNISTVNKKVIETEYYNGAYGYINSSGSIQPATGGSNLLSDKIQNVQVGDRFIYTGGYGWTPVWGYYEDGTAVALVSSGYYANYIFEVTDANIKTIVAFSGTTLSLKNYSSLKQHDSVLYNDNCYTMRDFTTSVSNATISNKTSTGCTLTLGSGVYTQGKFVISNASIEVGDWCFVRLKITSNADAKITLLAFTNSGAFHSDMNHTLKAGIEYEIYFRSGAMTTTGELRFYIESSVSDSSGQVLTISHLMITINNEDAWIDLDTRLSLKDFSTREIIVDSNGGGHFYDINKACIFVKQAFDVANVPVTILVKNGYYLQPPTNTWPYAAINKGANKISIHGESRDGVVIECFNTSVTQSKVLDIGGECAIENLTLRSLNDGTYTLESDLGHNCYALHNDSGGTASKKYVTAVKNCKLYSECNASLGAGLQDWQTQRYEKVESISNSPLTPGQGAIYIHASNNPLAANMAVEIIDCTGIALDETKALTLGNVVGSLPYTEIPVTIQRTIGYTNGENVTDANFKAGHNLQPQSALNNIADFNY